MPSHFWRGILPESYHGSDLSDTDIRLFPGAAHHIKAFHRKVNRGWRGAFIMPVANDDILWDEINRCVCVIAACLPLAQAGQVRVQQTIPPQPELPARGFEMI